jgi:hypothetical protein
MAGREESGRGAGWGRLFGRAAARRRAFRVGLRAGEPIAPSPAPRHEYEAPREWPVPRFPDEPWEHGRARWADPTERFPGSHVAGYGGYGGTADRGRWAPEEGRFGAGYAYPDRRQDWPTGEGPDEARVAAELRAEHIGPGVWRRRGGGTRDRDGRLH